MAMNQFVKNSKQPEMVTPTSGYNQRQRKGLFMVEINLLL